MVWRQLRLRPDHFPLDTANSPSCLSLKRWWWWWWEPAEPGYFMPNTSRFGSGPDQMPLFHSLFRTGDNQALEELSMVPWKIMHKSRRGSLSAAPSAVNQKHCVSPAALQKLHKFKIDLSKNWNYHLMVMCLRQGVKSQFTSLSAQTHIEYRVRRSIIKSIKCIFWWNGS